MTPAASPRSVAVAWVEHLRAGGTTTWADWVRESAGDVPPAGSSERGGRLPGAGQLELVRRLGLEYAASPGRLGRGAFTALADRALSRSGPGRGLPDLPLALPGSDRTSPVGAPPTDPGSLPVDELIRHGVGLLADLLVDAGPVPRPSVRRRRVLARHAFHLAGAPVTTSGVRASLAAAGRVEGGWSPEVVLFAEPLDEQLAQVWSTRVQHGAPVRWETFAGRWARRDALPPSADLPAIASFWAAKVGVSRVHVVVSDGVQAALPEAARRGRHPASAPTGAGRRPGPAVPDGDRRGPAAQPGAERAGGRRGPSAGWSAARSTCCRSATSARWHCRRGTATGRSDGPRRWPASSAPAATLCTAIWPGSPPATPERPPRAARTC